MNIIKLTLFLIVAITYLHIKSADMKYEAESCAILSYSEKSLLRETLEIENSRGIKQKEILIKTLMHIVDNAHALFLEAEEKSRQENDEKESANHSPFQYSANTAYSKFKKLCKGSQHIFFKKTISQWADDMDLQEIANKLCFCNVFSADDEEEIIVDWQYIWTALFQNNSLDKIKSAYEKFEFNIDEAYITEIGCLHCKPRKKTFKEIVSKTIIWNYLTKAEMILLHSILFNQNSVNNKIVKIKDFAAEISKIKTLCERNKHHYYSRIVDIWHSIKKLEDKQYDERENYCLCTLLTSHRSNDQSKIKTPNSLSFTFFIKEFIVNTIRNLLGAST